MTFSKTLLAASVCVAMALISSPALAGKHGGGSKSSHSMKRGGIQSMLAGKSSGKNFSQTRKSESNMNTTRQATNQHNTTNNNFRKITNQGKGNLKSTFVSTMQHNNSHHNNHCHGWKHWCRYGYPWLGGYCRYRYWCRPTTVVQPIYTPVAQPVAVEPQQAQLDLELVEVRQIDQGDAAKNLGPAYRVTLRNKSGAAVSQQFNVLLAASLGRQPTQDSALAEVRVAGLEAGQMLSVDVRLPAEAYSLGTNADGQAVPFAYLTAVADSQMELPESDRADDYMVLSRGEIVLIAQK